MVPLAERVVDVALLLEVVRHRLRRLRHDRVVAGEAHRGERVAAQPDGVRIAPRHEGGAGGRAQRRGVEVVVAQSVRGQPVDVRRLDQAAETADLGEADVVEQQDQHVGRALRGAGLFRPPFLRFLVGPGDLALELARVRSRQTAPHRTQAKNPTEQPSTHERLHGVPPCAMFS